MDETDQPPGRPSGKPSIPRRALVARVVLAIAFGAAGYVAGGKSRDDEIAKITADLGAARTSLARARAINGPLQAEVGALRGRIGTGRALSRWDSLELTGAQPANGQPRTMWKSGDLCLLELVGPPDDLQSATVMTGGNPVAATECAVRLTASLAPDATRDLAELMRQSGDSGGGNVYVDANGLRVTVTMNQQLGMMIVKVTHVPAAP